MLVIGSDQYVKSGGFFAGPNQYGKLATPTTDWYVLTGALNSPTQFINHTVDTALCATIIPEEQMVAGALTLHTRFVLPHDELGARDTTGLLVYVREIWIDTETHYPRRMQIREVSNLRRTCTDALAYELRNEDVLYTSGMLTYSKYNKPISPPLPTSVVHTISDP